MARKGPSSEDSLGCGLVAAPLYAAGANPTRESMIGVHPVLEGPGSVQLNETRESTAVHRARRSAEVRTPQPPSHGFSDAGGEQSHPAVQVLFAFVPGSRPLTHHQHWVNSNAGTLDGRVGGGRVGARLPLFGGGVS